MGQLSLYAYMLPGIETTCFTGHAHMVCHAHAVHANTPHAPMHPMRPMQEDKKRLAAGMAAAAQDGGPGHGEGHGGDTNDLLQVTKINSRYAYDPQDPVVLRPVVLQVRNHQL